MALAGEDQNQIAGAREFAGAGGDFLANAADDPGFGLAGGPGGAFPFAHLGKVDGWHWHGVSVAKFSPAQKENVVKKKLSRSRRAEVKRRR